MAPPTGQHAFEEGTDCCRAFLFGGLADTAIRGNYIQDSPMAAIEIENTMTLGPGFLVEPPSSNLTIGNNVIDSANWTATGFSVLQLGSIEVMGMQSNYALLKTPSHRNIALTREFHRGLGQSRRLVRKHRWSHAYWKLCAQYRP
jgi:hypothetical protein